MPESYELHPDVVAKQALFTEAQRVLEEARPGTAREAAIVAESTARKALEFALQTAVALEANDPAHANLQAEAARHAETAANAMAAVKKGGE